MSFAGDDRLSREEPEHHNRERRLGMLFLGILAGATLVDLIIDSTEGTPLSHMAMEGIVIALALCGAAYLWLQVNRTWSARTDELSSQVLAARADAARWRDEARSLARGLSDAIDRQLESWGLSPAEKDVAFLLIKGLSLKEIATLRDTTERTVRQQATTIYRKGNLEGRAQLSAFFLEDLLVQAPADASRSLSSSESTVRRER